MMTTLGVEAVQEFGKLATREAGKRARQFILEALQTCDSVEIDMTGMNVSPSFADEFFGMLAGELGVGAFERRVQLTNLSESAQALIAHVVYRRASPQQTTNGGLRIPIPTGDQFIGDLTKATRKRDKKDG